MQIFLFLFLLFTLDFIHFMFISINWQKNFLLFSPLLYNQGEYRKKAYVQVTALHPLSRSTSEARPRRIGVHEDQASLIHIRHTRYYVDDNGPRINIHAGDAHKCYRCILHIASAILRSRILCLPACLPACTCIDVSSSPLIRDEDQAFADQDHQSNHHWLGIFSFLVHLYIYDVDNF